MRESWLITRESLSWIRMTRTARQDARRSGKEDAGHSLFLEECLFGFYGEHNCKIRKGSCRDVTWRCPVVTRRLIRDWSYLLTFCVSYIKVGVREGQTCRCWEYWSGTCTLVSVACPLLSDMLFRLRISYLRLVVPRCVLLSSWVLFARLVRLIAFSHRTKLANRPKEKRTKVQN